jgi:hypothetical protein
LKTKNNCTKELRKKIQKNENQSEKKKHNKLRFKDEINKNKKFTKEPRAKDKN